MEFPRLSVRIPPPLLHRFREHVDRQGLTLSNGVIAAHRVADLCEIAHYVGDVDQLPLVERLTALEAKG